MSQWNPGGTPDPDNDPNKSQWGTPPAGQQPPQYGQQPQYGQEPQYGQQPPQQFGGYQAAPQYAGAPAAQGSGTDVIGILSIVFAVLCSPVGIILGIIGLTTNKGKGRSTTLPMIGLALGVVFLVLGIIIRVAS